MSWISSEQSSVTRIPVAAARRIMAVSRRSQIPRPAVALISRARSWAVGNFGGGGSARSTFTPRIGFSSISSSATAHAKNERRAIQRLLIVA
jgi:hypothetical protein